MCESNSEDMTSFDILPAQNGTLESFDSSEFSLIPEQPPFAEGNAPPHSAQATNLPSALMSATFDLSDEEIQKRLVELAEDNRSLRESLQSSSAMMKSELSAIATWHNNITSTIAQQQISLQEAYGKIQELEKEKADLVNKMKEDETKPKEIETSLKAENTVLSDEDSEYEIVQKRSLKDSDTLRLQLKEAELKIVTLLQEVEEQNLKIESMKTIFMETEEEKNTLKSQLTNQDELNSKLCDLRRKVADYEQTTDDLQAKVKNLEEQLQDREPSSSMKMASGLQNQAEHEKKLNALKEENEKALNELEAKVAKLEKQLSFQQQTSEAERVKHHEAKKLLSVVQSNYDRVTKILQLQSRSQREKTESMDSERVVEAKKNLEQIDSLTAKLFDLEQKLEEREEKVIEVTRELSLLKEDSESIPILKAQVEVLKIDLDNAVLTKEAAHEEVVQLTQQLKDLQAQGTASFCSNCGAGSARSDSPARGNHGKKKAWRMPDKSNPELIICPVCQFGFTDLQAAQNHVNGCIDKSQ